MKKNDVILIISLLIVCFFSFLGIKWYQKNTTKEATVVVTIDGKEYSRYSLNEDRTVTIESKNGGVNVLKIHDGYASMIKASCPDKICKKHQRIKNNGETIVCLPNKVVVEIQSKEEGELDAVTN